MNILPHKSWHVRNKDNIQKVKRDEAKAAAEEKEKQKRIAIAESEARINKLRSKLQTTPEEASASSLDHQDNHVNLFEQEEQGKFNEDKNLETELEKKQEKEKYEKKIGLLTYLNQDQIDLKSQPWVQTTRREQYIRSKNDDIDNNREVDLKRKLELDPLNRINNDLNIKTKNKKSKKSKKKHRNDSDDQDSNKKKQKTDNMPKSTQSKTIEQLRAERLKREAEERAKAERLLNGDKQIKQTQHVELDDRKRRYNSQFNPDIAKN